MFNVDELKILRTLVDTTPIQGTLHTLPAFLSQLISIRKKIDDAIQFLEKPSLSVRDIAPEHEPKT